MPPQSYVPTFPWDLEALPFVPVEDKDFLPALRGLYFIKTPSALLYLGLSVNIAQRFQSHPRIQQLADVTVPLVIAWLPLPSLMPARLRGLETQAITHYQPKLNGRGYRANRSWFTPEDRQAVAAYWNAQLADLIYPSPANAADASLFAAWGVVMTARRREGKTIPASWTRALLALCRKQEESPDA